MFVRRMDKFCAIYPGKFGSVIMINLMVFMQLFCSDFWYMDAPIFYSSNICILAISSAYTITSVSERAFQFQEAEIKDIIEDHITRSSIDLKADTSKFIKDMVMEVVDSVLETKAINNRFASQIQYLNLSLQQWL